jgi:hypothetical protein
MILQTKLDSPICQTGPSGLPSFEQELSILVRFVCEHIFNDSAGESTTSNTSSMKGVNSGHNRSDLNKGSILKPTFDTMTEEGY